MQLCPPTAFGKEMNSSLSVKPRKFFIILLRKAIKGKENSHGKVAILLKI